MHSPAPPLHTHTQMVRTPPPPNNPAACPCAPPAPAPGQAINLDKLHGAR
jgi:hypothetical protein